MVCFSDYCDGLHQLAAHAGFGGNHPGHLYFDQPDGKKAQPLFFEIRESFSRLNSMVEENIGGNRVVKAFARENFEIEKFNHFNDDFQAKKLSLR